MVRTPCCKEEGIKKGAWTPEEDQKLIAYLHLHGEGGWRTLPEKAGLKRCGKSCRLRWANYLRPDIKRGEFSPEEDDTIIKLHAIKGNKWAAIATSLAGRTDNEIKNYWNTNLKKRLLRKQQKSIDLEPISPKPINSTSKPVGSSGCAKFLNRVASNYAVNIINRDLLTGIIIGNTTTMIVDEVDSPTENSTNKMSGLTGDLTDELTDFFGNEEISDMYTSVVDNVGLMEELKSILNNDDDGAAAGDIKDSMAEIKLSDEMDFLDSWNGEYDLDLDMFVSSLDTKVGVFV